MSSEPPSLFPTDTALPLSIPVTEPSPEELAGHKLAKEFVRWCCGFGSDFHNSPDVTNLRYWMQKYKIRISGIDEDELLIQARRLYFKRIEQSIGV